MKEYFISYNGNLWVSLVNGQVLRINTEDGSIEATLELNRGNHVIPTVTSMQDEKLVIGFSTGVVEVYQI